MQINDERKFLHDISSPVGTALLLIDMIAEGLQEKLPSDANEIQQIAQAAESLDKLKKMIVSRREILIQRGVPSAKELEEKTKK